MGGYFADRSRFSYAVTLPVLLGFGVVSVGGFLYLFVDEYVLGSGIAAIDQFTAVLLLGVPGVGLCYAGYWLHRCSLDRVEIWEVGQYALGGVGVGVLLGGGFVSLFRPPELTVAASFLYLVGVGSEGALLGFLVGMVTTTDVLSRDRSDLQRRNERLNRRVASAGHDLRSPLNVAQGRLQLAREECDSEHLEDVAQAHDRMGELIDDLLILARTREATLDLERVGLANAVEDCWSRTEAPTATLETRIERDRTILADTSKLQQLLENLVRNAVEHGGGDVTVRVGSLSDGFYVADDGPGIPESEREKVFESGYSTETDGTGFGLDIVEQVVEAHGWELTLTESEAGGARFEITRVEFAE